MRTARTDAVPIAILSAAALSTAAANLLMNVPPLHMALNLVGVCAYAALALLGDYDPHILCDTVQSGETAVATLALGAAALFITVNPYLLLAAIFIVLIMYQLFMKAVLAPAKKEIALAGMAAQAVLAAMAVLVVTGGLPGGASLAGPVLTGFFSAAGVHPALPAVSLAAAILIPLLFRALNPEMRLLSQGLPFSQRPRRARVAASAGLIVARGLLAAISFLFAGLTCCIGISVRRLHRGALPDAAMFLSMACLGQAALLVGALAGPLRAAAVSWACSYAVFSLYYTRRVHVYDRYQQS
ncbi:MAG TPA: hypothetical protein PLM53_09585 [Spirochaetota bacterium]|nr:hypothetical protein [Spirochaetota bacterium]HPC40947.1 hypothetical protein [Spirochaetota bacterium]HPL18894.1 hypothetical protein [Spirochaetota bacterium]HQF08623.1 hypothetical protein [Spirochaetota bacterium]HQH97338.1 hypothetical protein [Spirochaetota bacterium]